MRITLMHNPKAGRGKLVKRDLMAALARAGHLAIYQSTKKSDYKEALREPADLVLAAGGDGTVGKVGRELIDTGIPLSVLPLGTANNLARSLRSEEHTSELQSPCNLVCRLLLEKKKKKIY